MTGTICGSKGRGNAPEFTRAQGKDRQVRGVSGRTDDWDASCILFLERRSP